MSRLVFPAPLLAELRRSLLLHRDETCAVGYGHAVRTAAGLARIVVQEIAAVPPEAYLRRTPIAAVLSPAFVSAVSQRARRESASVVFVHTHPFPLEEFSPIDDRGEAELRAFFNRRTPGIPHAALLLTSDQSHARLLGETSLLKVWEMGSVFNGGCADGSDSSQIFDRQVRAFGAAGQRRLQSLAIGIVGLGGTGSIVAQQLAHLGVRRLVLMDPDNIEESNLNRVVCSSEADIGRPKVDVSRDSILRINPSAEIVTLRESVLIPASARRLLDVDLLFCCTDSHGSRAVLNQIAYQFLLPVIDLGVVIAAAGGEVKDVVGRVQLLSPGLSCLACDGVLDSEQVRRDFLTLEERRRDPYIVAGEGERQPAVISLNGTVASLAITMLLQAAVGIPGTARRLHYNAISGATRPVQGVQHPHCVVCSRAGMLSGGDSIELSGRRDA